MYAHGAVQGFLLAFGLLLAPQMSLASPMPIDLSGVRKSHNARGGNSNGATVTGGNDTFASRGNGGAWPFPAPNRANPLPADLQATRNFRGLLNRTPDNEAIREAIRNQAPILNALRGGGGRSGDSRNQPRSDPSYQIPPMLEEIGQQEAE
ncbi:hypothetical protein XA68_12327 [Ophiocordyceps unilateralis]|uniref:Uncharacterized protein n=1 Tax=Ophiocordyceps unilateralis TaxID=268505 RepID=A0A2A9PUJ3_OPHUN|nr:hypothetical protein XA68_12327 [Ophiocordyceps unilateralis]